MSDISGAVIPRKDEEIEVFGIPLKVSFSIGSMSIDEFDYFKTMAENGELTPQAAAEKLVSMDFQWDATIGGEPVEVSVASLRKNVKQAFLFHTLLEVLSSFAPKEPTSSTSVPGSRPKASGARSRGTKKGAS